MSFVVSQFTARKCNIVNTHTRMLHTTGTSRMSTAVGIGVIMKAESCAVVGLICVYLGYKSQVSSGFE